MNKDTLNGNDGYFHVEPSRTAWIAGQETGITYEALTDGDWRLWKPTDERQRNDLFDSNFCMTYSMHHTIATVMNWMMANGKIDQNTVNYLRSEGYMDSGSLNFNEAFSAKLNGTTINGNGFEPVWKGVQKNGLIPQGDWIDVSEAKTWNELMAPIPQSLLDKGQEFLRRFNILFEFATAGVVNKSALNTAIKQSPLQIAIPVGSHWNQVNVPNPGTHNLDHGVELLDISTGPFPFFIEDDYSPFVKQLSSDYFISYAVKCQIVPKLVPTPLPEPPEAFKHLFYENLKYGMTGLEVIALQTALYLEGFMRTSNGTQIGPTNYFGQNTKNAVVSFQEKYAADILAPLGLKYGTGFVSTATNKMLNKLYAN